MCATSSLAITKGWISSIINMMILLTVITMFGKQQRERTTTMNVIINILKRSYCAKTHTTFPVMIVIYFQIGKCSLYFNGSILLVTLLRCCWVIIYMLMERQYNIRELVLVYFKSRIRMKETNFKKQILSVKKVLIINITWKMNQHQQSISEGHSPLHLHDVLWLFDSLKDDHHYYCVWTIFTTLPSSFVLLTCMTEKYCVTGNKERNMRHSWICQARRVVKEIKWTNKSGGTVKATILMGYNKVPCLVMSSAYNTKPIHYLSITLGKIK